MSGKLVGPNMERRIRETIETVNNLPSQGRQPMRRRVRTGGKGGSDIVYIEITASTDINTYTGTIYDNPIDRNSVEAGVTVKALQHDAGTIPNSDAGEGFFCYKNGTNYYILNYSVFYG